MSERVFGNSKQMKKKSEMRIGIAADLCAARRFFFSIRSTTHRLPMNDETQLSSLRSH